MIRSLSRVPFSCVSSFCETMKTYLSTYFKTFYDTGINDKFTLVVVAIRFLD